jgi:hypothetical protein
VTSRILATSSALVLAGAGLLLLFAADDLLPRFVSGVQGEAAWIGQVLGAAWLGIAALNWLSRGSVLGGIYGRPIVRANAFTFFITTTVLLGAPFAGALVAAIVPGIFALLYGSLLFHGPFRADRSREGKY